jgi:hypothetical protein
MFAANTLSSSGLRQSALLIGLQEGLRTETPIWFCYSVSTWKCYWYKTERNRKKEMVWCEDIQFPVFYAASLMYWKACCKIYFRSNNGIAMSCSGGPQLSMVAEWCHSTRIEHFVCASCSGVWLRLRTVPNCNSSRSLHKFNCRTLNLATAPYSSLPQYYRSINMKFPKC